MTAILFQIDAPSIHDPYTLVAGDDWELVATFYDDTGAPLNLSTATIQWTLLDANNVAALTSGSFTIGAGTAAGECTVTIPAATTTKLAAGMYSDFWRISLNSIQTTMLQGVYNVHADPFAAAAAATRRANIKIANVRAA